ncbi:MAG: bifunctional UDP-N-acetylmuramoyl-tripeptide:D-alanyl-D-alanine ligase/alanine racemase [Bacteroidales bacterium]|nr:bifunctional UDP-N-acetylmuramoyl-tripeptide:D-alanyl-D-alanine ligase/alanine racemase [Bacteroidales bacterium]
MLGPCYHIEKVTTLIGAHRYGETDCHIRFLLTDSRSLAFPESTLFFAIPSPRQNPVKYIPDLYRRGVRNFVVADLPQGLTDTCPDANFLVVVSPLKALQRLAERHREEYDVPVVGVTGSNGKTEVKEWLYALLSPAMTVTRSPRSYNSQVGVPLSVWLMGDQTQVAVFEAGISKPGEMAALRDIIQPTLGVMTNLGTAHQENFSSMREKCLEKLCLFKDSEVLVYDADDPLIGACVDDAGFRGKRMAWSRKNPSAPLFVKALTKTGGHTDLVYVWQGQDYSLHIPFADEASLTNCLHCLTMALCLGLPAAVIAERMPRLEHLAMRLEVKGGQRGCTIIDDAYNSDVNSLDIALDFVSRRRAARRVLIVSDILQTGLPADELYAKVAEMVQARGIDLLVGVGHEICRARHCFEGMKDKAFFADVDALMADGLLDRLSGSTVLVKGARSAGFERITDRLSLKVHETILEVNLGAIADNLNFYRSHLRPETRVTCMVKASAYGAGSVEVARTLQDRGVDCLAVAVADEGVALREAGITGSIMVMNPEMTSFRTLFEHRLEPEVYNFGLLEALIKAAEREGIQGFPIHLKLDTGMHRLGFNPKTDIAQLIDRLHHQSALMPRSVFSHFVGSDSPDFDAFSAEQFRLFDEASLQIVHAWPHRILRHICNSAAIERFPERQLDMVRLGLGLYGVDPIDNRMLHNVTTLKTTILQIREVAAGDSIGYSRRTFVDRPSRIAAIPIGYADGLDRRLGNRRGYCLVGNQKAPYVGNICMDVCMIDVTDIDCQEGDTVEIYGDHLPVTVLSDLLETIPYEILTSVSDRVKRVYFQ